MITIRGTETVKGYSPKDVFAAGTIVANLPKNIKDFSLTSTDEILLPGSEVAVDLVIPSLGNKEVHIVTSVTEYEPGELIVIEGCGDIASTALVLELEKRGKGTAIMHELSIEYLANRLQRILVETGARPLVQKKTEEFTQKYKSNIVRHLGKGAIPLQTKPARPVAKLKKAAA